MLFRSLKYDSALHWHYEVEVLGKDDHGLWIGVAADTRIQRGAELAITPTAPFVRLIPPDSWWSVIVNDEPSRYALYADVAMPISVSSSVIEMTDLDLDVVRYRDRTIAVLDEDEFEERRVTFAYPPSVVTRARATAVWLEHAMKTGIEPFGSIGQTWLDRFVESG